MCLLAVLHHTHLLRSASTVLTPGGALSHQLHMFRSTNNASSDLTAETTGFFPRSDARLQAPQTSAQLMALAPSSSVCAKDSRVSGHDFVWADRELILVGAVHPLLGSLAARLLEHALPCAILIGAETGSLPSKEAKLSVTTSKKSTDANRKATALGIARLSMRGGAQEAKRRSQAFEQSVKDEDRKRFGQVELAKETAARAHLAVEDAFVLASRDAAPGDPLPLSVVNAHAPEVREK